MLSRVWLGSRPRNHQARVRCGARYEGSISAAPLRRLTASASCPAFQEMTPRRYASRASAGMGDCTRVFSVSHALSCRISDDAGPPWAEDAEAAVVEVSSSAQGAAGTQAAVAK